MHVQRSLNVLITMLLAGSSLLGCQHNIPREALTLSEESLQERQIQTRVFETDDERMLLSASAALLQDTGYQLDESEVPLGVIVASRDRDVVEVGQVIASAIIAGLFGVQTPVDSVQKVLASVVTKPLGGGRTAVRVTFQHMVWNTNNQLTKNEQINDSEIYEEFFSKLSKSVFLEAHGI